jgi:hypothetical protein
MHKCDQHPAVLFKAAGQESAPALLLLAGPQLQTAASAAIIGWQTGLYKTMGIVLCGGALKLSLCSTASALLATRGRLLALLAAYLHYTQGVGPILVLRRCPTLLPLPACLDKL